MKQARTWQGVRMRRIAAAPDPDAETRLVTLPAAWDERAAAALAALAPGEAPVSLAAAAAAWIDRIGDEDLGERLHRLLLLRRGAPSAAIWRGERVARPGFVLNLPAFLDGTGGFDVAGYGAAIEVAVAALTRLAPGAEQLEIGVAGLDGLLAGVGLDYDSPAARDVAACLAALLRRRADACSAALAGEGGVASARPVAVPPAQAALPGLAEAARAAPVVGALRHRATTAITAPGLVEALLGVETGGIAPAFSPLDDRGRLTASARARLLAAGVPAETALAQVLAGHDPLAVPGIAAHQAMHDAVGPFLHAMPARPEAAPVPPRRREALPARARGYTQRSALGGRTVFIRTGEYGDGRLGEITLTMPKESAAFRGLLEAFAQAVSVGLQHGAPLEAFVEALGGSQFGPGGAVEGDPAATRAGSVADYAMRHLAASYLGRRDIEEPELAPQEPEAAPLLPLDLPAAARGRRGLRLVHRS